MRYQGSKNRHAKDIIPFFEGVLATAPAYVEPFVGGFNMMQHVAAPFRRIANDVGPYVVALFEALLDGWQPPGNLPKSEYEDVQKHPEQYTPEFVGFVGFACSYAGKFFGGYAQGGTNAGGAARNHCGESKRSVLKQVEMLNLYGDIDLRCGSYDDLDFPIGSVVYCDPPYKGTTEYKKKFDTDAFWEWVRWQSLAGSHVFVSEYEAPPDFRQLWQKDVNVSHQDNSVRAVERLFQFEGY